jgi:hypothetical protein
VDSLGVYNLLHLVKHHELRQRVEELGLERLRLLEPVLLPDLVKDSLQRE